MKFAKLETAILLALQRVKTNELVKIINSISSDFDKEIIKHTCKVFQISINDFFDDRNKKNEIVNARRCVSYLLYKSTAMNKNTIAALIKRSRKTTAEYIKVVGEIITGISAEPHIYEKQYAIFYQNYIELKKYLNHILISNK